MIDLVTKSPEVMVIAANLDDAARLTDLAASNLELKLEEDSSPISIPGDDAVVVGRSNVVGKPAALLLLREHCTVTVCHSRTVDLGAHTRAADIVVVAAGRPGLITGTMLKPGAVVVDVGINMVAEGIVGDVDMASASAVVSAISPVPGGVGPITNAILLQHLLRAARDQVEGPPDRRLRRAPTRHPAGSTT